MSEYRLLVVSDSLDQPRIERVVLSPLGAGRYRLDDQDVLGCRPPLFWQDVIEAKEIDDAELQFIRVVQRADPSIVLLELGEDVCTVSLTPVGLRTYRLESTQWQVEPSLFYHDLIEADQIGEARFRYVRLAQRSELEVQTMTPPHELIDTAEALSLLHWLSLQGGHWQRDWGNVLVLSIPKDAENEFDNRWEQIVQAFNRGLLETGTAAIRSRPYGVRVSLDQYREGGSRADLAASPPPSAQVLFGKPHEGGPLWRITKELWKPNNKKPERLEAVAMPGELRRRIDDWSRRGLTARHSELPPGYSGFPDEASERAYLVEGWNLYRELSKVLGEPLEFWDFASGAYRWQAGDSQRVPRLGKGNHCRVLARSADYALIGHFSFARLFRRGTEESLEDSLCVGAHEPALNCGVISPDQSWCATGGCGVIVYQLAPPFEAYDEKRQTNQWFHFERTPSITVIEMEALDPTFIRLRVRQRGEPIQDRLLDLKTRRLV